MAPLAERPFLQSIYLLNLPFEPEGNFANLCLQ